MKKTPTLLAVLLLLVCMSGCTRRMRAERHEARADRYYDAGQYAEAEIEYLNVVRLDRAHARAIGRLGILYSEQGRLARARPFLIKAHELSPLDAGIAVRVASLQLLLGNMKEARATAESVLNHAPTNQEAPVLLAGSVRTPSDLAPVRDRLDRLSRQIGDTVPLRVAQGALRVLEGDLSGAIAEYEKAIALENNSATAHAALGNLYWKQNRLTDAQRELQAAADFSPPRSPHRLEFATFKIKTGQVDAGKAALERITRDAPDLQPAWLGLADLAMARQQTNEFQTLIARALALDPYGYQALLLQARQRLLQRDYAGAVAGLERMLAVYPRSAQAHYSIGQAYAGRGDSSKALSHLGQALGFDPDLDEAALLQARLHLQLDQTPAAVTALNRLIERRPRMSEAYLLLGNCQLRAKEPALAAVTFARWHGIYPTNPEPLVLMGDASLLLGRRADARRSFEEAFMADGNYLPALEKILSLDLIENKKETALDRLRAEALKKPRSPTVQLLLAKVHLARLAEAEAEVCLQRALALDPGFQPAYLLLARTHVNAGRYPAALAVLERALSQNSDETAALLLKALVEEKIQKYSEARDTYEKLLTVEPGLGLARNNLACLYSEKLQEPDKALVQARKARELQRDDPAVADTLGWILFKRGDYSAALPLLQESAVRLFGEPEVQCHLGLAFYMLDEEASARQALGLALAVDTDWNGKSQARQALECLALDPANATSRTLEWLQERLRTQPADPVALGRLAAVYASRGEGKEAGLIYGRILKGNPKNVRSLLGLAKVQADLFHNNTLALALASEAYKLAPDNSAAAHTLGRLSLESGDYKYALHLLRLAAQADPEDSERIYDLALADYSVGRVASAQAGLEAALRQPRGFSRAPAAKRMLEMLGALSQPGQAAAFESKAQSILQNEPAYVPALMLAAVAAKQRGDTAAAARAAELAVKTLPEFVPALRFMALLESETPGTESRVYERALKARESLPQDQELTRTLGLVAYRRGDWRSVVRFLGEITGDGGSDARIYYCLGMAQFRLKNFKESKSMLALAQSAMLPPEQLDEVKKTLLQLR
jgi:tetratricopeptide (TPR) repeat protein